MSVSGPPPVIESSSCRQCGKSFNPLFRRAHACGHCGYEYCSNCLSDGQALMPRRPGQPTNTSALAEIRQGLGLEERRSESGYDVESVCLHCLGMLQVTAAPLPILRSLPLKRLKDYLAAYDIPCVGPREKEDFVQAVIKARNPQTGCLSPEAESFYRRRSVPKQGQITPVQNVRPPPPTQARPTRQQARPPPPSNTNRVPPRTQQYAQYRPPPPNQQYRPPTQQAARPPPPRSNPPPRQPSPPVPTILSLVSLPTSYLSNLSIGTLKAILYENHVRVDFKQVLEKDELISRVAELVNDERKRLERQRLEEEREARGETTAPLAPPRISTDEVTGEKENGNGHDGEQQPRPSVDNEATRKIPTGPMPEIDRGLCVVCQDEEATLAVVDCGHLAMCAHCSELIMATSRECPLCRTRIVTPQRLIRIYRV
ncbi:hypothetical protein BCR39DRAFT_543166 [Naematelia encephala]|uniref:RING-type domain-containing protein n=1 Tax=Naematelia encephala TaxID=71784 RepID=A0A1Y2AT42_9TREE|nr:hypothetical protein BCR39DRAFT_543166 [Naematelia encephala]